jgi:hypothetical protein
MKAMFSNVKAFAVFNSKPHLFSYGQPYQLGTACVNSAVFVELTRGDSKKFSSRVEQFGGVVLG